MSTEKLQEDQNTLVSYNTSNATLQLIPKEKSLWGCDALGQVYVTLLYTGYFNVFTITAFI